MSEECYFYIEEIDGNTYMRAMCVDCHTDSDKAWFWDGGFSHTEDVICHKCNKIIRKCEAKQEQH